MSALYWVMIISMMEVGVTSIGGGLASLPIIARIVVERHKWLDMAAFSDLVTISEMTPGPIGLNAATFVGFKVLGIPGAIVASIAVVIPSCLIVLFLSMLYRRYNQLDWAKAMLSGMRAAAVAMILTAALSLGALALTLPSGGADLVNIIIFGLCLLALWRFKPHPILVIVLSGVLGLVLRAIPGLS